MEKQCFTIVFETDHEPANGKFRNVILQDSANNILYFYDSCGAYTSATSSFIEGNAQILNWNEETRQLTISDGNTVNIPSDNTDNQILEYDQNTNQLSIERGNTVTLQTVDPESLPYGGTYAINGGLVSPGIGLQVNLSDLNYRNNGRRLSINNIPTQVLEPTVDTYFYVDLDTDTIQKITVGHSDAPPVFPDNQLVLAWVRSQAASVTGYNDLRLRHPRGYALRMSPDEFSAPNDVFTRVPFNTVGIDGYRFGGPFRSDASSQGVHRIPAEGIWDIDFMLRLGQWAGTYRVMAAIFVNGNSDAVFFQEHVSGRRGSSGSAQATISLQRITGSTQRYFQKDDLVEVRVWHGVGSTRTFGQDGMLLMSMKGQ